MPLFDKSTQPIYPDCYGYIGEVRMEIGQGWWVAKRQTRSNNPGGTFSFKPWYTLHHRHPNGLSVGVGHQEDSGTCATCDVYSPGWVRGAMKLIEWSEEGDG
jgi:hypothetical protein